MRSNISTSERPDSLFHANSKSISHPCLNSASDGIFSRDSAHKVARRLRAGTVWVNCYNVIDPISPFGGYKQSGIGRELGKHSIDLYTQIKSV